MIKAAGFIIGQTGDLVIQTAVAQAFKEQYPDSQLTFCCAEKYRDILPLFFHNKNIYDYHIWEGYNDWPTVNDKEYIEYRKFNKVFNAAPQPSSPDWYNKHHYIVEDCFVQGLLPPKKLEYYLNQWFDLYDDCKNVVTLTLFPSKGTQLDKGLNIEEAEKLCIDLKKLGYRPIQLGGNFEIKLKSAESPHFSILEATKLMLSSKLHITADTGFSSIAAGYHHHTLGFYGLNYKNMTDCFSHLPPNRNALYIKNRPPNSILASEIIELIKERLN